MKPDMVILQWWHPYFAPCFRILEYYLKKIPIVFVCHNVFPHEKFLMDKKLAAMVLKRGDAFIVQSKTDQKDLLNLKRGGGDANGRRIRLIMRLKWKTWIKNRQGVNWELGIMKK